MVPMVYLAYTQMESEFSRNLIRAFLSAENRERIRGLLAAQKIQPPSDDILLEEMIFYSREIEVDLRWTDPLRGTNGTKLLHMYNGKFVYAYYNFHDQDHENSTTHQHYYEVSDGLPLARFDQSAPWISADDLLDRWWKGGSRLIQTRDDRHGDRKVSAGDADYLVEEFGCAAGQNNNAQRNVYRGGAMATRATTWGRPNSEMPSNNPVIVQEKFQNQSNLQTYSRPTGFSVLGAGPTNPEPDFALSAWLSPTARAWSAMGEDYQHTPLGVSTPAADARMAERNLSRKSHSNLENGIPYYRFPVHHRHYDKVEASAGLDGSELVGQAHRRWDMSGLYELIDAKQRSRR